VDEVLCHVMRAPHTYTREDVVEINGHGGPGPLNAIMEATLSQGARLARPGEFTLRAFLNGRIDLIQAEAVIDQIQARTRANLQAANAASSGVLSRSLYQMRGVLLELLARVEAVVDFPEDDLPDVIDEALMAQAREAHQTMLDLLRKSEAGRVYRDGAILAIAGIPNVGKSSLFNALLRDARAIVSAQAGTTRDRLEEYITLSGVPVKLIDTAGVRHTEDEIERLGVQIARDVQKSAQVALLVLDASRASNDEDYALFQELLALGIPVVIALNKCDLIVEPALPTWASAATDWQAVSAMTGTGLAALEETLGRILLGGANVAADEALVNRLHQQDSLRRASECVGRFLEGAGMSPEFLALDLQEGLQALGELTGETTPDEVLGAIFGSFCIGK
jgi:tRNA modification GTPase